MRVAIKFAYDGKPFRGYARQPNLNTVEGKLIQSLKENGYIQNAREAVIRAASRTDKGVSSLGNVLAFNTEKNINDLILECNDSLQSILIYGKKIVDETFYPRYANQRIYAYYLKKDLIDLQVLHTVVPLFIGTYNFSNFARVESHKDPMRTIDDISIIETESFYVLKFQAQTFLWHQIRRIVSAILQVKRQKITIDDIMKALHYPEEEIDFGLAPSFPLILEDIIYNLNFELDKDALKKKEEFENHLLDEIRCLSSKNANRLKPQKQQSR